MLRLVFGVLLLSCAGAFGCGDGSGAGSSAGTGGTIMLVPGPTCTAFCALVLGECGAFVNFDEASCRQGCEQNLADERAVSEACGDAVEAVFQCVTELDCEGVYAWRDAGLSPVPVEGYPCSAEVAAVNAVQEVDPACGQDAQN